MSSCQDQVSRQARIPGQSAPAGSPSARAPDPSRPGGAPPSARGKVKSPAATTAGRLSRRDLTAMVRQLGEMFGCGVPLSRALEVLSTDLRAGFAPLAGRLLRDLEVGSSLSGAFRKEAANAPESLLVLIEIGEETGQLSQTLAEAANWMEADEEMVRHFKSVMAYPMIVLGTSGTLALFLFTTVVPRLIEVVSGLGGELPLPTRIASWICFALFQPATWLCLAGIVCLMAHLLSNPSTRAALGRGAVELMLPLPLLSRPLTAFFHARFAAGLAVLSGNGVDALKAIRLAQQVSENPLMVADMDGCSARIQEGASLTDALAAWPDIYDSLLVSFVSLGEETGRLSESMHRLVEMYELEVRDKLEVLQRAAEPVLTLLVGGMVAFVLVATLLPLYAILSNL